MNFGEKKNIIIAGGIAAVAIIILVAVLFLGNKKKGAGANDASGPPGSRRGGTRAAQTSGTTTAKNPGAAANAFPGGGGGGTGSTPPLPSGPGAVTPTTETETVVPGRPWGPILVGSGERTVPTRHDPTLNFDPPAPIVQPEQRTQLPPVQTQEGGVGKGTQQSNVVNTIANRRVAGVKFNGGAWAILEDEGRYFIVKPGDVVDGTKITSISREAVYIKDPTGQPMVVPLKGGDTTTGTGAGAVPTTSRRVSGMPESPSTD